MARGNFLSTGDGAMRELTRSVRRNTSRKTLKISLCLLFSCAAIFVSISFARAESDVAKSVSGARFVAPKSILDGLPANVAPVNINNLNNSNSQANTNSADQTSLRSLPPLRTRTIAKEKQVAHPCDEVVQRVIRDAESLERENRWSELLQYYEASLRAYQHHPELFAKYHQARYHHDVARRYHDASFLEQLQTLSIEATARHFRDVITRLQNSHIASPTWNDLFQFGVDQLEISLNDSTFRTKHGITASAEEMSRLLTIYRAVSVNSQHEMEQTVWRLAEDARRMFGISSKAILFEALAGATNSLDPYTAYLTKSQLEDSHSMISGHLVGIGVELTSDRESLVILRVISGSPAREAGLAEGDRILAVDGESTRHHDTDRAADLLQGNAGSVARLTIQTRQGTTRTVAITRRRVDVPSIEDVHMLTTTLGYAKLTCFQMRTVTELREALWTLYRQGMTVLVLDLRHNPGGLLPVCVEAVDLFIDKGVIVRTSLPGGVETPYMATAPGTWQVPLIVLIDEDSASAAEIFAGAIRDHQRGIIIGNRSFGKDSVQAIHPFFDRHTNPPTKIGGLRVTTENFFSPNGHPFTGVGVSPDVQIGENRIVAKPINGVLPIPTYPNSSPDDPCIREAITVAPRLVPSQKAAVAFKAP